MSSVALPGQATLVANWRALARASPGASVQQWPGAIAAVFPSWAPLNNAIARSAGPEAKEHDAQIDELVEVYDRAGVATWAYWVPSDRIDLDAPDVVEIPSLVRDTTTLVMRATLDDRMLRDEDAVATSVATAVAAGDDPVPASELVGAETEPGLAAWVLVRDGRAVAGLWTQLHDEDCGIYGVGTVPAWRRRGCARALINHVLCEAFERGARTASLQSTRMAVSLYESLGFEAVGRYEEWFVTAMDRPHRRGAPTTR